MYNQSIIHILTSTPVKDLFCEIVLLFSFQFFVGKLVILKLEPQELQLLSFESPLYQFTMLQFIFGPLSIASNFKPLSCSKRTFFDAYEQTRNTSHCKTAAVNSFCSKSHLCTSRRLDCVRNDGAMPPHTCQDFYFSQSRSRLSTWNFSFKLQKYKYVHNLKDADCLLNHHNQRVGPLQRLCVN